MGGRLIKLITGLVAVQALVLPLVFTPTAAYAASGGANRGVGAKQLKLGAPRQVLPRALKPEAGHSRIPATIPFHPKDLGAYKSAKRATTAKARGHGVVPFGHSTRRKAPELANTTAADTAFSGMSRKKQVSLFGSDQKGSPPDTQLAAGPTSLLEMTNSTGAVYSKSGALISSFDLQSFYRVPRGYYFSDPWTSYDAASGRFFASGLSFNPSTNDSIEYAAVSDTADPSGSWSFYAIPLSSTLGEPGFLGDQPKMGVTSDKVVLSWNDFNARGNFKGGEVLVLQKADMLSAAALDAADYPPDPAEFAVIPATILGSSSTAWLLYNNSDPLRTTAKPTLGIIAIDGTPAGSDLTWSEWDPQVAPSNFPPYARQPWGTKIDTGDTRLVSAVWQNGLLWAAGNDRCTPRNDTRARSCLRLFQVSIAGSQPAVTQDFDLAVKGRYLSYPAVAPDDSANLSLAFNETSSRLYPSLFTATIPAGTSTPTGAVLMRRGQGPIKNYDPRLGVNRWGDYSGAAQDPADTATTWFAGEFAATSSHLNNWGTEIGNAGAAAPPDTKAPSLTKIKDAPDPFSPNGDGHKDKTRIHWTVSEGSVATIKISTRSGRVVRKFAGYATKGSWYVLWNGRNSHRHLVKSRTYVYRIRAVDAAHNMSSVRKGTTTVRR